MNDPASLVRAAFEHLNAHDLDAHYALLTDDVVSIGVLGRFEGKDAVRAGIDPAFDAMPDHWRRIERMAVSDESVATWTGGTVASTGEKVEIEGCVIWTVQDGRIRSIREYPAV
jgi:ketosteroid isomerase-like protein